MNIKNHILSDSEQIPSPNSGGTITINNLTAATYASIVVTLNGCSSVAVGPFTLSDPNPPAAISHAV